MIRSAAAVPFVVALAFTGQSACSQTNVPPPPAAASDAKDFDRVSFSHALLDAAMKSHVRDGRVDYAALKGDPGFREYLRRIASAEPQSMPRRDDRLAFWIDAYNALTIHGILQQLDVTDSKAVDAWRTNYGFGKFFKRFSYRVAGRDLTLDAIEHEIIRKEYEEPRVHFALVCASTGCPPLRSEAYVGERLDAQLEDQARKFLADRSKNRYDPAKKTLTLSPIFDWFASDFEPAGGRLEFVRRHVSGVASDAKIEFGDYDWSLNAAPRASGSR